MDDAARIEIRDAARDLTLREMLAASYMAVMDDCTAAEAARRLTNGRGAEHSGDCRKLPWTCMRCYYENHMRDVDELITHLDEFGVKLTTK